MSVLSALLMAMSMPPLELVPLAFVCLVPLAVVAASSRSGLQAFLMAWVGAVPIWMFVQAWVFDLTLPGWLVLCGYMALYPASFTLILRRLLIKNMFRCLPATIVVPVAWCGLEFFRSTLFMHGYPWYQLGSSLAAWPVLAQSADLQGVPLLGVLVASWNGLLVDVLLARTGRGPGRRGVLTCLAVVMLIGIGNVTYGTWRIGQDEHDREGPVVLAIQTNVSTSNKVAWSAEEQARDFTRFIGLTTTGFSDTIDQGHRPDLVVWPETMLPGYGLEEQTIQFQQQNDLYPAGHYLEQLVQLNRFLDVPLLVGAPVYTGLRLDGRMYQWDMHFNGAYMVQSQRPYQRIEKVHLTPFGERMPYIEHWPWLQDALLSLGASGMKFNLDAAESPGRMQLEYGPDENRQSLQFGVPICFEDSVASLCRSMVYEGSDKVSHLLVNISNDGWFGESSAGRLEHVRLASLRCIENRVPMVRSVNTGYSVLIDSRGLVVQMIGPPPAGEHGVDGHVAARTSLDDRVTLYGRLGDIIGWTLLMGAVLLVGISLLPTRPWCTGPTP